MNNKITVNGNQIIKTYKSVIACDMDKCMLNVISKHGMSPKIIATTEKEITMENIQGETLYEILEKFANNKIALEEAFEIFKKLTDWIYDFWHVTKEEFGDEIFLSDFHLKNFIYSNGKIYGIDFEKWEIKSAVENEIMVPAWISLYDFDKNEKIASLQEKLIAEVSQKLYLAQDIIKAKVAEKCEEIKKRREIGKIQKTTSAVIVSGGKSSRMGGFPKSELKLGNYKFIDHILYALSDFDDISISANNTNSYNCHNLPIIPDNHKEIGGLGGIEATLATVKAERMLILPCDFPNIKSASIAKLISAVDNKNSIVATINGRVNPLVAIYNKTALEIVQAQIATGDYKLMNLLAKLPVKYVEIGSDVNGEITNINTKEKYAEASEEFAKENFPYTTFTK